MMPPMRVQGRFTRASVLREVARCDSTPVEVAGRLTLAVSTVDHYLRDFHCRGWVSRYRIGRHTMLRYRITDGGVKALTKLNEVTPALKVTMFVSAHIKVRGYAPTHAEIAWSLRMRLAETEGHIREALRIGYLELSEPGRDRNLRVVRVG